MKELRVDNISINENVEASSKTVAVSLKILQFDYTNFIDNSVKAAIQILYDVRLDRIVFIDEFSGVCITFNEKRKGELQIE